LIELYTEIENFKTEEGKNIYFLKIYMSSGRRFALEIKRAIAMDAEDKIVT
jgi:5-formaminoimidazole-4-carboxamide-1-beta-D-ribofuranosyl 5'-monophosphate synthetase